MTEGLHHMNAAYIACAIGLFLGSAAFAGPITYTAVLNGPNEPTSSLGTGFASVTVDQVAQTMLIQISFTGLTTPDTASHIHCCTAVAGAGTAGVATVTPTFTGFPSNVTAGTYTHTFLLNDAGTYNTAFVTAQGSLANAETALLAGIASGNAYVNIHTTQFPGGEIRGFLLASPEPSTLLAAGGALIALALIRRRRA